VQHKVGPLWTKGAIHAQHLLKNFALNLVGQTVPGSRDQHGHPTFGISLGRVRKGASSPACSAHESRDDAMHFRTSLFRSRFEKDSLGRGDLKPMWLPLALGCRRRAGGMMQKRRKRGIPRKTARKQKAKRATRIQYAALPYRFTQTAALEILLVTTRQSRRWVIPKGWPIKGLRPAKSAAREAFEEAGVRGKVSAKSETWLEKEQRVIQWVEPAKAASLVKEAGLKTLIITFAKRLAKAAKSIV
jgi:ADP-ribose pyrophosphatase YjhB (NUDIX family)